MNLDKRRKYKYVANNIDPCDANVRRITNTNAILGEYDSGFTEYETKPKYATDCIPGKNYLFDLNLLGLSTFGFCDSSAFQTTLSSMYSNVLGIF